METMKFKLVEITEAQFRTCRGSDYNAREWNKRVDSIAELKNVKYYQQTGIAVDSMGFDRNQVFASYITPDGIFLLNSFSPYSCGISNAGFFKVLIMEDGTVYKILFNQGGKDFYAANEKNNRAYFARTLTPLGIMVATSL